MLKCLAKNPPNATPSAESWPKTCAASWPTGRSGRGGRATPSDCARCRRNPAVAALLAAVSLSLLLGTSVATFFAVRANQNAAHARKKQTEAEAAVCVATLPTAPGGAHG